MPLRYKSLHITFLIPFHPPTKRQRGKNSATSPSQPLLPPPLCQRSSPAVPPRPPPGSTARSFPHPPAPGLSSRCAATRSCGWLRARAANQAGLGLMYSPWPSAGLILPCAGASALHTTQPCSREGGTSRGMQQPAGEGGSGSPDRDANECQLKTVII